VALKDYEKSFLLKTAWLKGEGIDFGGVAREALTGKFGGAADVMLRGVSGRALNEPEYFMQEMSRIFGRGAIGVYEPIVQYVEQGLHGSSGASPVLGLLRQLGPARSASSSEKPILLHEHRIKDEEGNYPDNAD
jgi:hypothetical protein